MSFAAAEAISHMSRQHMILFPENPQTRATPVPGQPNGQWWFLWPSSVFPFLQHNPRTATLTRTHPVG